MKLSPRIVPYLQVAPLTAVLLVFLGIPLAVVVAVSFFDYDDFTVRPAFTRSRDEPGHTGDIIAAAVYRKQTLQHLRAENLKRPLAKVFSGRNAQNFPAVVGQGERDLGLCERVMRYYACDVIILGRL